MTPNGREPPLAPLIGEGDERFKVGPPARLIQSTRERTAMGMMQQEVAEWHRREFPDAKPEWLALIVCEEAGEVARAVLKKAQGIRTETDWSKELEKEAADVLVALLALADRFGFDLEQAWAERFFGTVSQRRFASAEPSILNVDGQFYAPTPL
jgi:NTP pyrophosphatase (non-canonical NTP hydrolase)